MITFFLYDLTCIRTAASQIAAQSLINLTLHQKHHINLLNAKLIWFMWKLPTWQNSHYRMYRTKGRENPEHQKDHLRKKNYSLQMLLDIHHNTLQE